MTFDEAVSDVARSAACRVANAGEGYGNLHQQDLVTILHRMHTPNGGWPRIAAVWTRRSLVNRFRICARSARF